MVKKTKWLGVLGLLVAAAGVVWATVTIEISGDGAVIVTAPGDRVTLIDSAAAPDSVPSLADPPAADKPSPVGGAPAEASDGFTVWRLHPDAHTIFVASDGDDKSFGDSESAPVRTLRRALQLAKSDRGDHILLRAGDTFTDGFGRWTFTKSGRDADHPLLVGVYGDGPRPVIETSGDGLLSAPAHRTVRNIALQGIHVVAVRRIPGHDAFDEGRIPYRESAVYWLSAGENVHVEDCVFRGFNFNLVFQGPRVDGLRNVTLRRNVLVDAWSHWDGDKGGHSSGLFADGVSGLRIEECLLDHNGWIDGLTGGGRTKFNHNLYIQKTCRDVTVTNNVVARGSSHGLQLRPGGSVEGNLFARNALGLFVARSESVVADNVVAESNDLSSRSDGARGYGIETLPVPSVRVVGNLLLDKRGRADWAPAIGLTLPHGWSEQIEGYQVTLENNTVVRWPRNDGQRSIVKWTDRAEVVKDVGNVLDRASGGERRPRFVDPQMTLDRAAGGDFEAWLQQARQRPRGTWPAALSAEAINGELFNAYQTR